MKLDTLLSQIDDKDPRKPGIANLIKWLNDAGIDLMPASTGASWIYRSGNYEGGLSDHILIVFKLLTDWNKAVPFHSPPFAATSFVVVAIGHVIFRCTDGCGHSYYVKKESKTGKALKCPWEVNDAYLSIPPTAVNIASLRQFIAVSPEELQAVAVALDATHQADACRYNPDSESLEMDLKPLTIMLRAAYVLSKTLFEKRIESA